MQRSLWIGGFAVGAILGTIILESGSLVPAATTSSGSSYSKQKPVKGLDSVSIGRAPSPQGPQQLSTFQQMIDRVSASQGGRISLGQIAAIIRATRSLSGTPTYQELAQTYAAAHGGPISPLEMLALQGNLPQPSYYRAPPPQK